MAPLSNVPAKTVAQKFGQKLSLNVGDVKPKLLMSVEINSKE